MHYALMGMLWYRKVDWLEMLEELWWGLRRVVGIYHDAYCQSTAAKATGPISDEAQLLYLA